MMSSFLPTTTTTTTTTAQPYWEHLRIRYAWSVDDTTIFVGRVLPTTIALSFAIITASSLAYVGEKGRRCVPAGGC